MDQLLAQERIASNVSQQVLWILPDHLGSTRDLVDTLGKVAVHYQYDSFGVLLDGRENVTRYQFTGREHDSNTDLNYHRARWYDPVSGKWMSEDPIGLAAGDVNVTRFVGNGVLNASDPSGLIVADHGPAYPGPSGSGNGGAGGSASGVESWLFWLRNAPLRLSPRLFSHWDDGSGKQFLLDPMDMDYILSVSKTKRALLEDQQEFKHYFSRLTLGESPTVVVSPERNVEVEYFRPTSKYDWSDEADMFYSFHYVRVRITWRGNAWCKDGYAYFDGHVDYQVHQDYDFSEGRNVPGSVAEGFPNDHEFWLYQQAGKAAPFNVLGFRQYDVKFLVPNNYKREPVED